MQHQTQEVLSVLRGAASQLGACSGSRPGTPRSERGAAADGGGAAQPATAGGSSSPPPSTASMLLQISALHKAFLALSDAFLEEQGQRQAEREDAAADLAALRRDLSARLRAAAAEGQQLAAAEGQRAHTQALLGQRCTELEQEVARLRLQLNDRQAEAADATAPQLEAAVARQLQAALPAAAQRAVARWAAEALPPLLQPMQEAVAATAELASSVAAEAGSLAGEVRQLAERCSRLEAAQQQQQQQQERGGGGAAAAAGAVDALQDQVLALQEGHCRLDEAVSGLRHQQATAAAAGSSQRRQQQHDEAFGWELADVRQQLAAVAEQQAQAAKTTEQLVQSVLTDTMALARHTKVLDKELRALRKEAAQTQAALLQLSSAGRKQGVTSPLGPFTSFPPQL